MENETPVVDTDAKTDAVATDAVALVVDEAPVDEVVDDVAASPAAAHGFLSELETRLNLLKEGVIRFDERQVAWLHAKASEIRKAL